MNNLKIWSGCLETMKYYFGNDIYLKHKLSILKGVIFDCDGVIIDSKDSNTKYYNLIKEKLGLPLMNREEEEYVHVHTVYESVKFIVPKDKLEEAIEISKEIEYREVLDLIKLEEGLREFLNLLKDMGIRCAINTNRTTTIDLIIDKFELKDYFDPIVTANRLKKPKPDPESVNFIIDRWRVCVDEVVYIGDSIVDEETAKNSHVDFWAYKNFDLSAKLYVPDYFSLRNWFLNTKF